MRVLLAGATGSIGRYLVPALVAAGHLVTGVTRFPGTLRGTGATELVADIGDRRAFLLRVTGLSFDAVIHEATALAKAPATFHDMRETNRLRTEGTSTLVAAAHVTGARRIIGASSVLGYGFGDHGPEPLTEDSPFGGSYDPEIATVFDALLSLEQQVRAADGIVLRYGIFYEASKPLLPAATGKGRVLPFVHLEDAAAATVLALEAGLPRSIYNIVDDTPASWREVRAARRAVAGEFRSLPWPARALEAAAPYGALVITRTSMVVSNAAARAGLGWVPRYPSFREGLAAPARESSPGG